MAPFQQVGSYYVSIRKPHEEEKTDISSLLERVFGKDNDARLVRSLRECGALVLERVAVDPQDNVLGHLALTRVTGTDNGQSLKISCLLPACVEPELDGQGIRQLLVRDALDELQGDGEDLVLAIGAPDYYSQFGFCSELAKKVQGPYAGAIFMALPLTQSGREELPIEVTYASPFEEFQ